MAKNARGTTAPKKKKKSQTGGGGTRGSAHGVIAAYMNGKHPTSAMEREVVSRRQKKIFSEFRKGKLSEFKEKGAEASLTAQRVAEDEIGKQRSRAAMRTAKATVAALATSIAKSDRVYTGKTYEVPGNPVFTTSNQGVRMLDRMSKGDTKSRFGSGTGPRGRKNKGDPPGVQMLHAYAKNPDAYRESIGAVAEAARQSDIHMLEGDEYESACLTDKRHVAADEAVSFATMLEEAGAVENGARVVPPQRLNFEVDRKEARSSAASRAVASSSSSSSSSQVRPMVEFEQFQDMRGRVLDAVERARMEDVAAEFGTAACNPDTEDSVWGNVPSGKIDLNMLSTTTSSSSPREDDDDGDGDGEKDGDSDGDSDGENEEMRAAAQSSVSRSDSTRPSMVRALLSSASDASDGGEEKLIEGTDARRESQTAAQLMTLLRLIKDALRTNNTSALSPDLRRNISDLMRRDETIRTMFESGNLDSKLVASLSMLIFHQIGMVREKKRREAMEQEAHAYIEARKKSNLEASGGMDRVLGYHAERVAALVDDIRRTIHGVSLRGLTRDEKARTMKALFNPVTDTLRWIAEQTAHPNEDRRIVDPTYIQVELNKVRGSLDVPPGAVRYNADNNTVSFAVMQTEMNESIGEHSIHALFWNNEETQPIVQRYAGTIPHQTVGWLHEMMRQPHAEDPYAVLCASPVCCGLSNSIASTFPKFRLHAFYMSGEDFSTMLQDIYVKNRMRVERGQSSRIPAERVEEVRRLLHIYDTEGACNPTIERRMRKCALEILRRRCVMCIICHTSELFNGNNKRATKRKMDEARASGDTTNFRALQREYERPIHPFSVSAGNGGFAASALLIPTTETTVFTGIVAPFPMWDETALSLCEITDGGSFYGYRFKPSNFQ